MRRVLLLGLLAGTAMAQEYSLDVIPLQSDPEQIARSFREHTPLIPEADCRAFDLWECMSGEGERSTDVSLRWVQLDDDPELEALIVLDAPMEWHEVALVFDKRETWRLVGNFWCKDLTCDSQNLIRVGKLTKDSPRLLWATRDLGGSGASLLTTTMLQLREGKLWPVLEAADQYALFPQKRRDSRSILASDDRIVLQTVHEQPPGRVASNKCEVQRWDAAQHTFVAAPADQATYCNPKTGKPIPGKSFKVPLPWP